MSRQPAQAAPAAQDGRFQRVLHDRRTPWGIAGALAVAAIALGVLLALGVGGDGGSDTPALVIQACEPLKDPNCKPRPDIHVHADFALFIDGQQFDFNDPNFASDEDHELSPIVHIHAPRYTVVHVHKAGTTWDEFFSSLGFKLVDPTLPGVTADTSCLTTPDGVQHCADGTHRLQFMVNGVKVDGVAFFPINDLDRVLISYGPEDDTALASEFAKVTDQACIPSLRCKDRVPADLEQEPCNIAIGCVAPGKQ